MSNEKKLLLVVTAAVMGTLLEMDGWAPKSIIQMALQGKFPVFENLGVFDRYCRALEGLGWITVSPDRLTLTEIGTLKAFEIETAP